MSVGNIVKKHKILKGNPISEEIINFYLIFSYNLVLISGFLSKELSMFRFYKFYFLPVVVFDWLCTGTKIFMYPGIGTVSHWWDAKIENVPMTLP